MASSDEVKSIFVSKTFWGAAVMLAATFAPVLFTHLGSAPDTATQGGVVDKIVAAAGFLFTLYGRWTANGPVSVTGSK